MSTDSGGEEVATTNLGSAPGSPKNKVKFLCSHGGKILPRPADGHLKYVGGETRVISVRRDINFPELMKKLTYLIDGDMVLKYQLIPEDLDALVSVKSDEDLRHMLDEYDRCETAGTPRLRAFLFLASPVIIDNQTGSSDPLALEQKYIDAVNGIIRPALKHLSLNINHIPYGISSACSSPRSPESCINEAMNPETMLLNGYQSGQSHMHRVHSSPSICNLNNGQGQHQSNHHSHQHHYHQNYRQSQQQHHSSYQPNKPPIDHHRGGVPERLIRARSVGRPEAARYQQVDQVPHHYYSTPRNYGGSGFCSKCMHSDEYGPYTDRRPGSVSPYFLSPRHGHTGAKAWDSVIPGDN